MASQLGFVAGVLFVITAFAVVRAEPNGTCTVVGELLPNENSCIDFYKCDNYRQPVLEACPLGLCYDEKTQICDYPQNVPCCYNKLKTTASPTPLFNILKKKQRRTRVNGRHQHINRNIHNNNN